MARPVAPKRKEKPTWENNKRGALMRAKLLFFLEYSLVSISEETQIPVNTLKHHAYRKNNNWKKHSKEEQRAMFDEALAGKRDKIQRIVGLTLQGLERFLIRLNTRESEVTVKDAKLLSDVLANTDRIGRLEAGEPTDIRRLENLTPEEVRDEVRQILEELQEDDPMLEFMGEADEVYGQTRHRKSPIN